MRQNTVRFLQLGDGPSLRGFADPWFDKANEGGAQLYAGTAVIAPRSAEQKEWAAGDGTYPLYETGRGKNGRIARRSIACVQRVVDMSDWQTALAAASDGALQAILTDESDLPAVASAGDSMETPRSLPGQVVSMLYARFAKGLPGVTVLCFEPVRESARRLAAAGAALALAWGLPAGFLAWLHAQNRFVPCVAERALALTQEKEGRMPARVAEGYSQMWCGAGAVPDVLLPVHQAGMEVVLSENAYGSWADDQRIWQTLLWAVHTLAVSFELEKLNAPVYDARMRAWVARTMLKEGLPRPGDQAALAALAKGMERLENCFYDFPPLQMRASSLSRWCAHVLPLLKQRFKDGETPSLLTLLTGIMLMEAIKGKEEGLPPLSCDMEPGSLAYAFVSDAELWREDLRLIDGFESALCEAFRNLQIAGVEGSFERLMG